MLDEAFRKQQKHRQLELQYQHLREARDRLDHEHAVLTKVMAKTAADLKACRAAAQISEEATQDKSQELARLKQELVHARAARDKVGALEHRCELQAQALDALAQENTVLREKYAAAADDVLALTNERHIMAERLAHERSVREGLIEKYEEYLHRSPVSPRSPMGSDHGEGFFSHASQRAWQQRSLFHELSVHLRQEYQHKPLPSLVPETWPQWLLCRTRAGLHRWWTVRSLALLWRRPPLSAWKASIAFATDWRVYWIAATSGVWLPLYALSRGLEALVEDTKPAAKA
ncbi:hypothetical protein ACHHYP_11666 [Achlya hypogyna]|uniref:Uncharacterized protein n=1 Tax=Achlya hypogyna TaxID=1202772 RepID=A0A1V9YIQ2_ACHHY|nr:hypothetical protein ACHHYP_11666 [Achlya hypogyna]